jgi:hypothetical protein
MLSRWTDTRTGARLCPYVSLRVHIYPIPGGIANIMATAVQHGQARGSVFTIKGDFFGARGGSCSCDPCDCNPCTCGDSVHGENEPSYPLWRVSGYLVRTGLIHSVDVSDHLILSLTQPVHEGKADAWQEVILVDDAATNEQITALLEVFEDRLDSVPAEVRALAQGTGLTPTKRVVYRTSMNYIPGEKNPTLHVDFTPDQKPWREAQGLQGTNDLNDQPVRAWHYHGPTALRETFDLNKS